ncbi:hypothetical protein TNCV_2514271 [Trichonephila clavipes]|nr:hypothetical protein TNCV_2514271 [Trichonephila clavipes]
MWKTDSERFPKQLTPCKSSYERSSGIKGGNKRVRNTIITRKRVYYMNNASITVRRQKCIDKGLLQELFVVRARRSEHRRFRRTKDCRICSSKSGELAMHDEGPWRDILHFSHKLLIQKRFHVIFKKKYKELRSWESGGQATDLQRHTYKRDWFNKSLVHRDIITFKVVSFIIYTPAFGAAIAGNSSGTRFLVGPSGGFPLLPEPLLTEVKWVPF